MLFSYFDDSSDDRRRKFFAAGGLIGSENQWGLPFDFLWLDATRELKKPFRSTECECQLRQFENWSTKNCNALMDKLVSVIGFMKLSGFASIVPIDEYRQIFPKSGEFDPYYLAVAHTIINMAEIGYRIRHDVKLWFEDSSTKPSTNRIYDGLRAVADWGAGARLKGISFDDKGLCPLQAADLVAREAFKHLDNLGLRPTRIPVKRMGDHLNFIVWNRATLEYLRDNGGPHDFHLLTHWGKQGKTIPPMTVFWRNF